MTMTMTMPTQKTATVHTNAPLDAASNQALDISPSEVLSKECTGCRLIREMLIMTKGISSTDKAIAATALKIKQRRAFQGGSTSIYDSKSKAIVEHNDFFGRIEKFWRSLTLPLAAMRQEGEDGGKARLEGGTRLIRRTDMEKFHNQMVEFQQECRVIERHLNEQRSDIMKDAREMLGDEKFDASLYPAEFAINVHWGFPAIEIPAYYAQMAPQAYEHERQLVAHRFEQNAAMAYDEFLGGFQSVMAHWVDRLGPRIRIYPPEGNPLAHLNKAEVLERILPAEDASIPADQFKLKIRYKDGTKSVTEVFGPMTQLQYSELLPTEADDKKKIYDTTIENLLDQLSKFERLGDLICPSDNFKTVAKNCREHLARMGNASDIATTLRQNESFKASTLQVMQRLNQQLLDEVEIVKSGGRKISRGLLKKES